MNLVCVVNGNIGVTKLAHVGYGLNASKSETRTEVHMSLRGSARLFLLWGMSWLRAFYGWQPKSLIGSDGWVAQPFSPGDRTMTLGVSVCLYQKSAAPSESLSHLSDPLTRVSVPSDVAGREPISRSGPWPVFLLWEQTLAFPRYLEALTILLWIALASVRSTESFGVPLRIGSWFVSVDHESEFPLVK